MAKERQTLHSPSCASSVPQRKGKRVPRRRSDILDQSPNRKRAQSPVSAPLSLRPRRARDQEESTTSLRQEKRKIEEALWATFIAKRSVEARNALWVHYQPLVRYIAERAKSRLPECIDVNDLISSGNIGLQDAILKFDPDRGTRFETFCVPRIRGAMVDSIRAMDWVPRLIRNKSHQYDRIVGEMTAKLGREPRDEEIAARMMMDPARFHKLKKELNVRAQISLEGGNAENADTRDLLRLEMLEDRNEVNYTRELQREEIRGIALSDLPKNERTVVDEYYFKGRTLKQIGDDLGLSESRICQIHAQVLLALKKKFRAYHDSCSL